MEGGDESTPCGFRRVYNMGSGRKFRRRAAMRRYTIDTQATLEPYKASRTSSGHGRLQVLDKCTSRSIQYVFLDDGAGDDQTPPGADDASTRDVAPADPATMGVRQKVQRFEAIMPGEGATQRGAVHYAHKTDDDHLECMSDLRKLRISPVRTKASSLKGAAASASPPLLHFRTLRRSSPKPRFSSLFSLLNGSRSPQGFEKLLPAEAATSESRGSPAMGVDSADDDGSSSTPDDMEQREVAPPIDDHFGENVSHHDGSIFVPENGSGSQRSQDDESTAESAAAQKSTNIKKTVKDFLSTYRSFPRPKSGLYTTLNRHQPEKHCSLYHDRNGDSEDEGVGGAEAIELRDNGLKYIEPILKELISTEENYVDSLCNGIVNYGNIFTRKDLPIGLRGKKYVLLGNIEQIATFHRDEFLPMLLRNRNNLKVLFDKFQNYVDNDRFYCYVIFTINKQRSLKLCDEYKGYFKLLQMELNDKLGINSFLVQPIQRIAKYPLLLKEFITTLFKHRDFVMKPVIESCCRLDKKILSLLSTTNESEVINDIIDSHEFNVFYQGKFRKVSEFNVFDHTLRRSYRSKVFIFDKCVLYTEAKGKCLVLHGRYPCEHIGIVAKAKSFTLFYQRRKQQECDFFADAVQIDLWLDLIRDMINSYAIEERRHLQHRYSRDVDHTLRKPLSLSLFRDSNRFSADSGIGNIWVEPKPEVGDDIANYRTTWYAVT